MTKTRAQFSTRLGVLATTVGSAVGLGNIWRFPYEAGTHGGGAFMLCYLFFVFMIGVPVICAEFVMGRDSRSGILGAFRKQSGSRRWDIVGYGGIVASVLIISFYSVVAGWTVEYSVQAATGALTDPSAPSLHQLFEEFTSGWRPVWWVLIFLAINGLVLLGGVQKGIERMSNIMMPALFVILIIFCINSLLMPAAGEGLAFLFKPDFSALTPEVVLGAMGQAFFSLSIGLGCMMVYGSYFSDETPLLKNSASIALLDTLVAILAGVIIFPAVFSFGISPSEGPRLVFEVLPGIFAQLPGAAIWSTLFFFLLFLASLSSTISMSEILIAWLCDEFGMRRVWATVIATVSAMALGSLCALSFGPLASLDLFNIFDFTASNILLPLGGMIISLYVGWGLKREVLERQMRGTGRLPRWVIPYLLVTLRFVAPICIAIVFIAGLLR